MQAPKWRKCLKLRLTSGRWCRNYLWHVPLGSNIIVCNLHSCLIHRYLNARYPNVVPLAYFPWQSLSIQGRLLNWEVSCFWIMEEIIEEGGNTTSLNEFHELRNNGICTRSPLFWFPNHMTWLIARTHLFSHLFFLNSNIVWIISLSMMTQRWFWSCVLIVSVWGCCLLVILPPCWEPWLDN